MNKNIDVNKASKLLKMSPRRIQQMCKDNLIKDAIKVNKSWEIPLYSLEEMIELKYDLAIPIGISDYKNIVDHYYYVDKTLIIKDIIDDMNQVSLFTRPRRFGKSLTMDMLKVFFEYQEESNMKYFKDKLIWLEGTKYQKYQGMFPVIYISLKDIKCNTWNETYNKLVLLLSEEIRRHSELLDSDYLSSFEKEKYKKLAYENANKIEYESSLKYLSYYLSKHYQQKCIIIIDEYDTPITSGYINGFYDEVINFMRNLLSSCLKDNNSLQFSFLTGILKVAKESIFSGLNNISIYSILDNKYSEYFGFTKQEVKELLSYYGKTNKYNEICEWYDGYKFGNNEIFNPWSVLNYLANDCLPRSYWSLTSSNDIIGELLKKPNSEIENKLNNLLNHQSITTYVDFDVIYPDIINNDNNIYSFLLLTGYLKQNNITNTNAGITCDLSIPNKEISSIYNKEIINKIGNQNITIGITKSIYQNDINNLKKYLEQYLIESVSIFDGINENFYHGMMLGLCALVSDKYKIDSNKESGYGRFDIELMPIDKNNPGFIFELKYVKNENELEQASTNALKQIEDNKYYYRLKSNNIQNIIKVGIAFCGKKAFISNNM